MVDERAEIAVVLALSSAGADPKHILAGLPLALRTVLTLQKVRAKRIFLVTSSAPLAESFAKDSRVKAPLLEVVAASAREGILALRSHLDAPFLVASHDVVVDPTVYRALAKETIGDSIAVIAMRADERIGPFLAAPALLDDLAAESLELALTQHLNDGRARKLDIGSAWSFRVTTPDGQKLAVNALFEACRKPVDGFIARNLNRHISIFISKRIVGVPITPNQLSIFTFLLGVFGALLCARGGYWNVLAGAFLFQWNSILDGVDGELARVRFQHSKLGQWLDTVSDDASNVLFYAGLGIGAASLPYGHVLEICAWVAVVTFVLASAQFYIEMAGLGTGDLYAIDWGFDKAPPPGLRGALLRFFRVALKKDFAIVFFLALASVPGVLPYALPVIAAAAISNLIAATVRNVRRRRLR